MHFFRLKRSLNQGICVQQIFRGLKDESGPPPDISNLQTMQDSNFHNFISILL